MTLRDRVENNLVFFLLSALVSGFVAGLGAYAGILRIADLRVVPSTSVADGPTLKALRDSVRRLDSAKAALEASAARPRHWLYVTGVDFEKSHVQARLVAEVDRTNYSFPTDSAWADGDHFRLDSLPLADDVTAHRVRFSARYTLPNRGWVHAGSAETLTLPAIPYAGEYRLYEVASVNRVGPLAARVKFEVRSAGESQP